MSESFNEKLSISSPSLLSSPSLQNVDISRLRTNSSKDLNKKLKRSSTNMSKGEKVKTLKRIKVQDWVFDSVLQFVNGPIWSIPIQIFVDTNCHYFAEIDGDRSKHKGIHAKYKILAYALMSQYLEKMGISSEMFCTACEIAAKGEYTSDMINQILAVEDFLVFKKMMQKTRCGN